MKEQCQSECLNEMYTRLNTKQKVAADTIMEYVRTGCIGGESIDFLVLQGYAGTGKTTTLSTALELIDEPFAMTAPTHKAVKVIKSMCEDKSDCIYGTIHALLGLTQKIDNKGKVSYIRQSKYKDKLASVSVLIIDEASMLDPELFKLIMEYKQTKPSFPLIFVGDKAQIPPVGHDESYVFDDAKLLGKYKVHTMVLDVPMRQCHESGILRLATAIREDQTTDVCIDEYINALDVVKCSTEYFTSEILPIYKDSYEINPDKFKVLAWTNAQVDLMNRLIREYRFNSKVLPKVIVGDLLIAGDHIIDHTDFIPKVIAVTSDELEVLEVTEVTKNLPYTLFHSKTKLFQLAKDNLQTPGEYIRSTNWKESEKLHLEVKCYMCKVLINQDEIATIYVLHELSEDDFKRTAYLLETTAKEFTSYSGRILPSAAWRAFYAFKESVANVQYNYALTVHKSQGSTFESVLVIMQDIDKNKTSATYRDTKTLERNRIKYVAVSRAKAKLYIT